MKRTEILQRFQNVYGEKAALRRRHEAVACIVGQYDVNNTYQYVIAREDQHLTWLADAIRDTGGTVPEATPELQDFAGVKGDEAHLGVVQDDAVAIDTFVDAWRPRAAGITHARHKLMLNLILGEMQEHARLFHQAAAGRVDLLGRRTEGERTAGSVLPTRWVE